MQMYVYQMGVKWWATLLCIGKYDNGTHWNKRREKKHNKRRTDNRNLKFVKQKQKKKKKNGDEKIGSINKRKAKLLIKSSAKQKDAKSREAYDESGMSTHTHSICVEYT